MTWDEFYSCIAGLVRHCGIAPTQENLDARLPELWEDMEQYPVERFKRGIKLLIRQPEFKYFPTVGEMLQAVEAAAIMSGAGAEGLSPARPGDHAYRMAHEAGYRAEQKRISEEAARRMFEDPEYQRLLKTLSMPAAAEAGLQPKKRKAKKE
jgi:hypothetical protein